MSFWSRFRRAVREDHRHTAEIQEELEFHLAMDTADGHARRDARLRLGNPVRLAEETRAAGVVEWIDSALRDVRYGFRQIARTPGIAAAIIFSLAIGIGANTAIFSLVDAALLRPLPVADPASLRILEWTSAEFPRGASNINGDFSQLPGGRMRGSSVSSNAYRALARQQTSFASLVGVADPNAAALAWGRAPAMQISLQYCSANFFQGLGLTPLLGRAFQSEDDRVGPEPSVIVSHRFWVNHLGKSPDVIGMNIRINNAPAHIIGVAPPGFFGLQPGKWNDVYATLAARAAFAGSRYENTARGDDDRDWWVRLVARLKPDVPEAVATQQIAALFRGMNTPADGTLDPKKVPEIVSRPGERGFGLLRKQETAALRILLMLVAVLLLIVCANVANLLLARSVRRQRESSVRLALGASRSRLFRQHLIESGALAFTGGLAGLFLGYLLAHAIHNLFQTGRTEDSAYDLRIDSRILAYTTGISVLAALLFGLAPAIRSARMRLNDTLKMHARSLTGGGLRLPRVLVSVQIALCLAALVAAGLLGHSLENLKTVDIGFNRDNLAYVAVSPSQAGYDPAQTGPLAKRMVDAIAHLPGIEGAGLIQIRPLSGSGNVSRVIIPGRPAKPVPGIVSANEAANRNKIGQGLIETLGIPIALGRAFEPREFQDKSDAILVDENFARHFFPNRNPVGLRFGFDLKDSSHYQIVGVLKNSRYNNLRDDQFPVVWEPYIPESRYSDFNIAVRARLDSGLIAQEVRNALAAIDPAVPVTDFHTQNALIDRLLRTERLLGFVSGAFSFFALMLAAIGLGSLLSYMVARRTNEIGVRMAIGASTGDVISLVLRDSCWMIVGGLVIGLPCAWFIARYLKSALFGLQPTDPFSASIALALLLVIALLAAWIPARRAAGINPVVALREE